MTSAASAAANATGSKVSAPAESSETKPTGSKVATPAASASAPAPCKTSECACRSGQPNAQMANSGLANAFAEMVHSAWAQGHPLIIGTSTRAGVPFAYTVGVSLFHPGQPEIGISGMHPKQACGLINGALKWLSARGNSNAILADGDVIPAGAIANVEFYIKKIDVLDRHLVQCTGTAATEQLKGNAGYGTAVQMVWPNKAGNYSQFPDPKGQFAL